MSVGFRCLFGLGEDEAGNQADQGESLNEGDTQEHGGAQLTSHLGLTCHALKCFTNEDADANARADGGNAVADGGDVARDARFSGILYDYVVH